MITLMLGSGTEMPCVDFSTAEALAESLIRAEEEHECIAFDRKKDEVRVYANIPEPSLEVWRGSFADLETELDVELKIHKRPKRDKE